MGRTAGGVSAIALFDAAGEKTGIEFVALATGERRLQASAVADLGGQRVGRYSMDDAALAWAAEVIVGDIQAGRDLIVVDEIGPLELTTQAGLAAALPALLARPAVNAIVIVRPELLAELESRLCALAPRTLRVTLANRGEAPALIMGLLGMHAPAARAGV
jgi:nucleoside-triphosphatase THEP1